ncbi:hypothetical protein LX73_0614 [Fodinibius salinus]|uniref:Tfp pilus assembly protein PilN n=1 Tax=Fodinibius salinus TaxID=860790 RepID=A0A5D3YMD5_9BACT|nr:hypothetical protein [Fodinibius salinus]TYP95316.1 hypothetical protein LX73_0614 [Fodinibius salinus]
MFGKKDYIGLAIEGETIRVARVRASGSSLKLIKLDQFSLVEKIGAGSTESAAVSEEGSFDEAESEADSIFGLDEEDEEEDEEEIDLEDFGTVDEDTTDMVDEADTPQSNELLMYDILSGFNQKKVHLGLNVPSGNTIFQIIRDTDFNEVKEKDLVEDLEEKLASIYGEPKSSDQYSYEVREDGSLLLASIDNESETLQLINNVRELYSGKIAVNSVVPDEISLVGLVRVNYELDPDEVTGIIQFSEKRCRVVFMQGEEVWLVSPIINEGTNQDSFLNTVFSKILFQLDTGEVPSLDRIILANNPRGEEPVDFFSENFPDIPVENLTFKDSFYESENVDPSTIPFFTTAIGSAFAASGVYEEDFPDISLLPQYVADRQKIFKLQWHGMLILFLIFLMPITFNYFYTQNVEQIESLSDDLTEMNDRIEELNPIVDRSKQMEQDLATLKGKLVMLDTLTQGSQEWSQKLQIVNEGLEDISNTWITSFAEESSGGAFIQGYSLYRERITRIVNIFDEATLMNVNNETLREQDVYSFSILISSFAPSDSIYSPSTPKEVKELIESEN